MRDVGGTGEAFDRRPSEPVPGEVERADRDARIDDAGVGDPAVQAVLPGARKQRQRVGGSRQASGEGGGDLMHVLADPGALPERRAIVEQDPQVGPW